MKNKKFIVKAMMMAVFTLSSVHVAADPIMIPLTYEDPEDGQSNPQKDPETTVMVIQDNNVLTVPPMTDDLVLQLRDSNGLVIYTALMPAGTTQVVLPTTLTGTFELRLVASSYYYVGNITL